MLLSEVITRNGKAYNIAHPNVGAYQLHFQRAQYLNRKQHAEPQLARLTPSARCFVNIN